MVIDEISEKLAIASLFVDAATLMAAEIHAGEAILPGFPPFPAATTVATPCAANNSMTGLSALLSQADVKKPTLRLILTDATASPCCFNVSTCSSAKRRSELKAPSRPPTFEKTWIAIRSASGATPATIPATWVPWSQPKMLTAQLRPELVAVVS